MIAYCKSPLTSIKPLLLKMWNESFCQHVPAFLVMRLSLCILLCNNRSGIYFVLLAALYLYGNIRHQLKTAIFGSAAENSPDDTYPAPLRSCCQTLSALAGAMSEIGLNIRSRWTSKLASCSHSSANDQMCPSPVGGRKRSYERVTYWLWCTILLAFLSDYKEMWSIALYPGELTEKERNYWKLAWHCPCVYTKVFRTLPFTPAETFFPIWSSWSLQWGLPMWDLKTSR